jgi:UDPglucose--hexose-1-phosphate uridylyltransferase
VRRQISVGQYVVERGEKFIAIKPFASRYEWEVHILPLEHRHDFLLPDPGGEPRISRGAAPHHGAPGRRHRRCPVQLLPALPAPFPGIRQLQNSYHWHLEICPRTSIPTGFELGSGLYVSTISPEDAARQLREVSL